MYFLLLIEYIDDIRSSFYFLLFLISPNIPVRASSENNKSICVVH